MIDNTKEYILCAAIKRKEPRDCQPYHPNTNDICNIEQGFYTSKGRYVDRYEGMEIAFNAGQVSEEVALHKSDIKIDIVDEYGRPIDLGTLPKHKFNMLFSEDLY